MCFSDTRGTPSSRFAFSRGASVAPYDKLGAIAKAEVRPAGALWLTATGRVGGSEGVGGSSVQTRGKGPGNPDRIRRWPGEWISREV